MPFISQTPVIRHTSVIFLTLLPLLRLIYWGYSGDLGANPIEFITRYLGQWSLNCLCLTLAISPLQWCIRHYGTDSLKNSFRALVTLRRSLGLMVFFYASLHFLIWLWLDQNFNFTLMIHDIIKRPFITMGFISFVGLVPLALTSNQKAIKILKKNWLKIHKLIYLISITILIHFYWHKLGKHDFFIVSVYALVIFGLLFLRVLKLKR